MSVSRKSPLFIATTTDPDLGGIARSVPKLADVCKKGLFEEAELQFLVPRSTAEASRAIDERAENISFIYHAGVWDPVNHSVAKAARRNSIPLVVSTRSMLDPWALDHRKWKKKLAWWLYARRDLMSATLIHATAEMEAEFIRDALGEGCPPIIVVPNGVELPEEDFYSRDKGDEQDRLDDLGLLDKWDLKRILFLSRIHPKKGVLDLIKAFGDLNPDGWELVIAGNDDGGHQAVCADFASHQVNADRIRFMGAVSDADKWDVYRNADLFVLPSYSENFGIVIGEALGMGVPVITTTATPWDRMKEKGCGWWIEPGVESLIPVMQEAVDLDSDERASMGQRGSEWIRSEFTWESVGEQFVEAVREHGLL
jgi:glycosyltransferase involved in cell wall biosynthesis